jgi:hypothetical protein
MQIWISTDREGLLAIAQRLPNGIGQSLTSDDFEVALPTFLQYLTSSLGSQFSHSTSVNVQGSSSEKLHQVLAGPAACCETSIKPL